MKTLVGKRIAVLALLAWMPAAIASAQYRAGIQGIVTDQSGARVPEATVTIVNQETSLTRTTTTSDTGGFSLTGLVPGPYLITIEKEGFASEVLENVGISAEQMQSVNVELEVGGAQDTVTVSAEAVPTINTAGGTIGGTLTTREVESLPSYGRDPLRLAQLTPGSFGNNARAAGGGSSNLPGNAGPGGTGSDSIISSDGTLTVSVEVANLGHRPGDEVVQLYVQDLVASVAPPAQLLRDFQRVTVAPGATERVSFTIGPDDLGLYDQQMRWVVEPGEFRIRVSSSSEGGLTRSFEVR
ncbi:MAG: hypothetical protein GEV06_09710 [Luteitalea sp.]|nr:hypothetical protein [Luteitalea sp.]